MEQLFARWNIISAIWLGFIFGCGAFTKENVSLSDEHRLFRKLMKNYEKSVRPATNSSQPITVSLGITLTQIFDMDEKNQVLTVNVWLDQTWHDDKMHWDPKDYGNLKVLRLPCDHLWLPDIVLYNSVDDYTEPYMRSLAMVHSDGTIFWPPIVKFRSSCKVDITYFPFDDQVCHMKMGSWAYDGFQVDVLNASNTIDMSAYVDNGEWQLISSRSVRNVIYYSCCIEPFPDVTFWFYLRRRTTYYTFNIIIPCVILSILTLACFLLPADSGEKVSLGLTVLLAFSVFMLLIAENMPATSEFVPLIGLYLTMTMAMTSMSVVCSVFVLHIHHKGGRGNRAPWWLRKLMLQYISRILFVRKSKIFLWNDGTEDLRLKLHEQNDSAIDGFRPQEKSPSAPKKNCGVHIMENGKYKVTISSVTPPSQRRCIETICTHQRDTERELLKYMKMLVNRHEKEDIDNHIIKEWQDVAAVVDRVLFLLFALSTLFSTLGLLVFKPITKPTEIDFP